MKTRRPLILTARISDSDLQPLDLLRQRHFPPDKNFLRAHLTMFHRLPGEYSDRIVAQLTSTAEKTERITAEVHAVRHLGMGVAFSIESTGLQAIRAALKTEFASWLGQQDMQKWQPHITVQNKATRSKADNLYQELNQNFRPYPIAVVGLDLWEYLGGPWQYSTAVNLKVAS